MTAHTPHPDLPPPVTHSGVIGWLRHNLFSSVTNTLLTLFAIYLLYLIIPPLSEWLFIKADWVGDSREYCTSGGACWVFINAKFNQFMYGFYPVLEYWRINIAFLLLALLLTALMVKGIPHKLWIAAFTFLIYPVIAYALFAGGVFGLKAVEPGQWGGLTLTLILFGVGIMTALPLGIILALGRRSKMPVVKACCLVFIELWRGVPLITVLFMTSVMLPLFLPEGRYIDKLVRVMIGIVLFQSAFIAEVVRGGLQAIPKGQYDAANALGLNYWKTMGLIILPQALKVVTPGIVNTFIALFKNTTLVLIIGLSDLLAMVKAAFTDPDWLGYAVEGYLFAAFVFWIFCFGMSRYSQSLERKSHRGSTREKYGLNNG